MKRRTSSAQLGRGEIAQRAARLLADDGTLDLESARRKAVRELGAEGSRDLPDNVELLRALAAYLLLFRRPEHELRISHMRDVALRAMAWLAPFQPRLVGPVLYGTACPGTLLTLQVFSDEFEAVTRFLLERRRPFTLVEARARIAGVAAPQRQSRVRVEFQGEPCELTVLPTRGAARTVLSEVDGHPLASAGYDDLAALVASGRIFSGEFGLDG